MVYNIKVKSLILCFMFANVTLFAAEAVEKKFDSEKGIILYAISGGGKLTNDVNLTIKGKGKLCFKEWGVEALIKEEFEEITSGTINNIHKVQRSVKLEDKLRLDVDFNNKKILERKMPKGNFQTYITKDLVKKGQEEIAGHICDIWEGYGVKKCIYKGIPLLIEHYLLGVYYQKKAIQVTLNTESTASTCSMPNYPVEKFALFNPGIKIKNRTLPKELSKILEIVANDMNQKLENSKMQEDAITEKEKRIYLNKIGQNIFEKQKKFLPQFLLTMKKARVCLQQAENWIEANVCVEHVIQLKAELTKDTQNNIEQWKGEEKNKVLDQFDENIFILESKMKCIRASQNISDLSNCLK